jgi:peptide/nickel transport system substrate-binding protein
VVFEEGIGQETAFLRFQNGEQDIVTRTAPADRALLLNSAKWKPYMQVSPSVDVWGLAMNCELAPFDNVHIRRAVAFAIDRERWSRARSEGLHPTGQMVPPQLQGYDRNLPSVQHFDLAKAREEMRLAGFPEGYPKPITFWTNDNASGLMYAQLAQADLAKIGFQLEIKPVNFPVFLEATGTRKTAQMLITGWQMDFPDPSNFLGLLHSNMRAERESVNRAFYGNPALDDLLDRGIVERDPERRKELYHQANELVAREAPWAFFGNQQTPQAWQPYVKNYHPHPSYWIPINEVWLDLPKKRVNQLTALLGPLQSGTFAALGGAR